MIRSKLKCALPSICLVSIVLFLPAYAAARQADRLSSEQIRQAASTVMQAREFQGLRQRTKTPVDESFLSRWLKELEQDNAQAETGLPGDAANAIAGSVGQLLMILALLIVATVIGVAIVFVIRSIERRKKNHQAAPPVPGDFYAISVTPPGELAANQYRLRAEQLARQGDFRSAIGQLLLGSMSWVERAGLIRFRSGLTNRDYFRAVWSEESRRNGFAEIAHEFEKVYFGRRLASADMFQTCLNNFLREFHEPSSEDSHQ
jgi:hypothetical protein